MQIIKTLAIVAAVFICGLCLVFIAGPLGSRLFNAVAATKPVATHEQTWIVDWTARDIAEMLCFAATTTKSATVDLDNIPFKSVQEPDASGQYQLEFNLKGKSEISPLRLGDFLWSPNNYLPWTKMVFASLALKPPVDQKTDSGLTLFNELGNYDSIAIAQSNRKISNQLSGSPLDAQAHEDAALLCSVFAIRECASCFTDIRPTLNRICAHLAIAKMLRGNQEMSDPGKMSEIALVLLSDRQVDAIDRIKKMRAVVRSEEIRSWLRAFEIRATGDYRIASLDKALAIEKFEYGRALAIDRSSDALTDYLSRSAKGRSFVHDPIALTTDLATLPIDWLRIALRGLDSVESGHRYAEPAVEAELEDYAADYKINHGANAPRVVLQDLNADPTRCLIKEPDWKLEALSWSDMCAFHARHILDSVFQKHQFEANMWGVKDSAKATIDESEKSLGLLYLYPLCKLDMILNTRKEELKQDSAVQSLAAPVKFLLDEHPERISSHLWQMACKNQLPSMGIPTPNNWFTPGFPYQTAFEPEARQFVLENFSLPQLISIQALAPYSLPVIDMVVQKKYGEHAEGDLVAAQYRTLSGYNVTALKRIAQSYRSNPEKYANALEQIAVYEPDGYFALGEQYVNMYQPEKAVRAYENAIKLGRDKVEMSNCCDWIVRWYFEHGQKEKAFELANRCADIYSARGLWTMARLYERMGQLADAEKYYRLAQERYDDSEAICHFYMRHEPGNSEFKANVDRLSKDIFPNGRTKVALASLSGKPKGGAMIETESVLTKKYDLKKGDVFVAIDGYRVINDRQYTFIRDADTEDSKLDVIVWDGKSYRNLHADVPKKRFGCKLHDY